MAGPTADTEAPPTLVDNVETLAHVARRARPRRRLVPRGRHRRSPGTFVCTVSGCDAARRRRRVHDGHAAARGDRDTRRRRRGPVARSAPCSRAWPPRSSPPTGSTRRRAGRAWQAIGSGLGAAAFIVIDDTTDIAVASRRRVSRFLAVESCGQCTPCKQDGLAITDALERIVRSRSGTATISTIVRTAHRHGCRRRALLARDAATGRDRQPARRASATDDRGARRAHRARRRGAARSSRCSTSRDGVATLDAEFARKQPDWTFGDPGRASPPPTASTTTAGPKSSEPLPDRFPFPTTA